MRVEGARLREGSGNEGSMQARVGLLKIPSPNRWERVRVRASVQTQGTRGGESPVVWFQLSCAWVSAFVWLSRGPVCQTGQREIDLL
jgi:hypothetical protein